MVRYYGSTPQQITTDIGPPLLHLPVTYENFVYEVRLCTHFVLFVSLSYFGSVDTPRWAESQIL
jgi:hypothetical protein